MPINGRMAEYDQLVFQVESSASGASSGSIGSVLVVHSAYLETFYAPDVIQLLRGVFIQVTSDQSIPLTTVTIECPGSSGLDLAVSIPAYRATIEARLVFQSFKAYGLGTNLIYVEWTALDLYVDNVFVKTYGSGFETSADLGPAYVPFFGIHPVLYSGVNAGVTGLPGPLPDTYSIDVSASATATGGWRIKDSDGNYSDGPVTLPTIAAPAGTDCPFGLSLPSPVAPRTWDAEVSSYARSFTQRALVAHEVGVTVGVTVSCDGVPTEYYEEFCATSERDVYSMEQISESRGCTILLVPDLDKSLVRMQTGHAQLVYRWGMPKTTRYGLRLCEDGGVSSGTSAETEVHPSQSEILSVIGDTVHACEDTLGYPSYAGVGSSNSKTRTKVYSIENAIIGCPCPPTAHVPNPPCGGIVGWGCVELWPEYEDIDQSEEVSYVFPYTVEDSAAQPDMAAYLLHDEKQARYTNTWVNPFWSYANWFPANTIDLDGDGEPDVQNVWPVLGSPIAKEYWMALADQYLSHVALPPSENRQSRTTIFSDALLMTGLQLFCDTYRSQLPFLGISRWLTQPIVPRGEYVYTAAAEPLFSCENATLAFGASSITITPT